MKTLFYGANGWIGGMFEKVLLSHENDQCHYFKGTSRVDDLAGVVAELEKYAPTHVVSFVGRTHGEIGDTEYPTIDYLEQPGKLRENIRDNLFAPVQLALLCSQRGIHLTYLGTGCIFESDTLSSPEQTFDEEALPNFFGSSYSTVKGFTDRLMHQFSNSVLNLRIRMPISAENHPRNFITKITNYQKICSIPNSMSVLPDLLPLVWDMMCNRTTGTVNLTNPGLISHDEILQMYKDEVDPAFQWKNFSLEEQSAILAAGRSNNHLDSARLLVLYPNVPPIRESVRTILKSWKK